MLNLMISSVLSVYESTADGNLLNLCLSSIDLLDRLGNY